ncbi:sulfatase-like hydrolase/transferase [Haloarchaeobius salinus]|uniref:sulfatase-like hydrolase/transferase n=1 Tax=Haloarchaeobius salinus TaxID=1198298 RepID=UPI00210BAEA1
MPRNVLFLVLDCLRTDAVTPETAPTLSTLAAENPSFESAIAPANWSLPSHASIFTGEYAHEHHVYHRRHEMDALPLVDAMGDRGYRTVGVTSNIYFSRGQGFETGFDEFYETRRPLNPHGLNPFSAVRDREPLEGPGARTYLQVLGDALRDDRPVASLGNYLRAVAIELDRRYDYKRRLPGFDADDYGFLTEGSDRSESILVDLFDRSAGDAQPFFAFANFMDTHYPYEPVQEYLDAVTDGEYSVGDVRDLDPDVAQSWVFLDEHYGGTLDEDDLDLVRAAYRAEVRCVDDRISRLLDALERNGLREETLVVVTSDHGEVLGETDLRGERSMGHLDSLSEHLRTVPLVLSNPVLDGGTVERPVPLHGLTNRLLDEGTDWLDSDGSVGELLAVDGEPVFFELPANPFHESSYDNYEHVPDWYAVREAKTHTVLGIDDGWFVAAQSDGTVTAWEGETERDVDDAPAALVAATEDAVAAFPGENTADDGQMSGDLQQQLEDLGYM